MLVGLGISDITPHAMAAFEEEKGLVGKIRTATESDAHDLAGYTEARARDLIEKSFSTPLEGCMEMVKFTFTIGGGKLVRSRYDDSLSKWIVSALRDLNFVEDRSAACDFNSQGTYKQQHDTGQNLKTISIFPYVLCAMKSAEKAQAEEESGGRECMFDAKESAIISADLSAFCDIVKSKTDSWSQRKRVLKLLQDARMHIRELEEKLVRGEMLNSAEQVTYDLSSGCDTEKIAWLQNDVKQLVDKGKLTSDEKLQLLKSISGNITTLDAEIESAESADEAKRSVQLRDKKSKMLARRAVVEAIVPITHRLKKSSEIQKTYVLLHNIHVVEDKARTMSLTLADLKKIEPKFELEQQLIQLQQMSRCWFESDEEFDMRCCDEMTAAKATISNRAGAGNSKKKGNVGSKATISVSRSGTSSWNTKSSRPSGAGAGRHVGGGNSIKTSAAAGGFAAAFGSDSDSDD